MSGNLFGEDWGAYVGAAAYFNTGTGKQPSPVPGTEPRRPILALSLTLNRAFTSPSPLADTILTNENDFFVATLDNAARVERDDSKIGAPSGPHKTCIADGSR